jgi:hypothetical protein
MFQIHSLRDFMRDKEGVFRQYFDNQPLTWMAVLEHAFKVGGSLFARRAPVLVILVLCAGEQDIDIGRRRRLDVAARVSKLGSD